MRQIWRSPGRVIAQIAHEHPWYRCLAIPVIASFAWWPGHILAEGEVERDVGLAFHLLLVFPHGVELPLQFIMAWLLYVSARSFGGRAALGPTVTALAWSNFPIALLGILCVPLSMMVEFPLRRMDDPFSMMVINASFVLTLIIVSWSWWILLNGLARVQGYSRWLALTHTLICAAVVLIGAASLLAVVNGFDPSWNLLFENWEQFVVIPESTLAIDET